MRVVQQTRQICHRFFPATPQGQHSVDHQIIHRQRLLVASLPAKPESSQPGSGGPSSGLRGKRMQRISPETGP